MPQLQSGYLTSLRSASQGDLGQWATFSGGEVTSETIPDRDPTQEYDTKSGGEKTIGEITISRRVELARDTAELEDKLAKIVGRTNDVTVGRKPLDANRAPFGKGKTWIGTVSGFTPTDSDNNSTGESAVITLTIDPSSVA